MPGFLFFVFFNVSCFSQLGWDGHKLLNVYKETVQVKLPICENHCRWKQRQVVRCEEKEERTRKAWHVSTEKILEGDLLQRLHKGFLLLLGLLWLCFLGGGGEKYFVGLVLLVSILSNSAPWGTFSSPGTPCEEPHLLQPLVLFHGNWRPDTKVFP